MFWDRPPPNKSKSEHEQVRKDLVATWKSRVVSSNKEDGLVVCGGNSEDRFSWKSEEESHFVAKNKTNKKAVLLMHEGSRAWPGLAEESRADGAARGMVSKNRTARGGRQGSSRAGLWISAKQSGSHWRDFSKQGQN